MLRATYCELFNGNVEQQSTCCCKDMPPVLFIFGCQSLPLYDFCLLIIFRTAKMKIMKLRQRMK